MLPVTWISEAEVFPETHSAMCAADLYACDRKAVVRAVSDLARESLGSREFP